MSDNKAGKAAKSAAKAGKTAKPPKARPKPPPKRPRKLGGTSAMVSFWRPSIP